MSAAICEPAAPTADGTGGAAEETGVEGGGGAFYIRDASLCVCVRLLNTQKGLAHS